MKYIWKLVSRQKKDRLVSMGKIFCLMGKSSSGKDTIFRTLIKEEKLNLKPVISYTTRPMRTNEVDGREYYFINEEVLQKYETYHKVIEQRVYQTVHGPWHYATIDDGQIDLQCNNYIIIVTLEAYNNLVDYFGQEYVIPIYIEVEDGVRLERAISREKEQLNPNYEEVCRRFLADSIDFNKQALEAAGIKTIYQNIKLEECMETVRNAICQLV